MVYIICKDGEEVNRIVADKAFCEQHYSKDGYSYALAPGPDPEPEPEPTAEQILSVLLGDVSETGALQAAAQHQRALQLFAASLDESAALEIPSVYPAWAPGRAYTEGEYLTYGINSVGDPQLYKVAQAHTSQAEWVPGATPALYTPIGLTEDGYPVWSPSAGAHDAYNAGDIVDYNGTLYRSTIDGNVWSPDTYPQGWEIYEEA